MRRLFSVTNALDQGLGKFLENLPILLGLTLLCVVLSYSLKVVDLTLGGLPALWAVVRVLLSILCISAMVSLVQVSMDLQFKRKPFSTHQFRQKYSPCITPRKFLIVAEALCPMWWVCTLLRKYMDKQ